MTRPERLTGNNIVLLVCLLALILFYPLFQKDNSLVRDLLLTGIFFRASTRSSFPHAPGWSCCRWRA